MSRDCTFFVFVIFLRLKEVQGEEGKKGGEKLIMESEELKLPTVMETERRKFQKEGNN